MSSAARHVAWILILSAQLVRAAPAADQSEELRAAADRYGVAEGQVADWSSAEDLRFFLHGSLSSEFLPERVLRAFIATFPDLFPGGDLSAYGVVTLAGETLPVGFSRRVLPHLGGQPSVGINCASCHVAELHGPAGEVVRVLGRPSHFDATSFFGAVAVAMLRVVHPEVFELFLGHYLAEADDSALAQRRLALAFGAQRSAIAELLAQDPFGSRGMAAGELHDIDPADLELAGARLVAGDDLLPLVRALVRLFHNVRTALHLPEQLPPPPQAVPGPGRNDAFNLLAYSFFGVPPKLEAPVKFGFTWNLDHRRWVHWDGNNDRALARNLAAAMGLGAPERGRGALVDFSLIERQTALTETLRPPAYPWTVDRQRAASGAATYEGRCASCHEAPEEKRLHPLAEIGTDPNRARIFDAEIARLMNDWVAGREVEGYEPPAVSWRATGQYWASDLAGVWARSPYLHNGSVRTVWDLLAPPASRPRVFRVGSRRYDPRDLGFADEGHFTFDTSISGNTNSGHDYGTDLSASAKRELIEYLKTL